MRTVLYVSTMSSHVRVRNNAFFWHHKELVLLALRRTTEAQKANRRAKKLGWDETMIDLDW